MYKVDGNRYGSYLKRRETSSQPRPYRAPLPYWMREGSVTKHSVPDGNQAVDIQNDVPNANGFDHEYSISRASNDALDDVYGVMGQAESLLVAWKERQKAIDLLATNIGRIVKIARAIKRRDPKIIRQVMGRKPKGSDVPKTPAALWLEYHFAVVPTIMDIHHAAGVLGHEFPYSPFSGSGRYSANVDDIRGTWVRKTSYETFVKMGGQITGLNPNVTLASQLGFGQPLSVAWEMTPFSWFVDYFGNVGQLVKNFEPRFPGVTIADTYTTVLQRSITSHRYSVYFSGAMVPPHHPWYERYITFESWDAKGVSMQRTLGLPPYQPTFISASELKMQQCSYIGAVLTGIFAGGWDKFSKSKR